MQNEGRTWGEKPGASAVTAISTDGRDKGVLLLHDRNPREQGVSVLDISVKVED